MPYKKVPCPECGQPKSRRSKVCLQCRKPYERTPEMRQIMSENAKGKQSRGTGWHHTKATRKKMAEHWTPERRAAKRLEQQLLYEDYNFRLQIAKALTGEKNPNYQGKGKESAYSPGYGAKYAKKLREQRGHCEICGKKRTLQMQIRILIQLIIFQRTFLVFAVHVIGKLT